MLVVHISNILDKKASNTTNYYLSTLLDIENNQVCTQFFETHAVYFHDLLKVGSKIEDSYLLVPKTVQLG